MFPLSPRSRWRLPGVAWLLGALALAVWLLLRIGLWLWVGPAEAGWSHVPAIFLRGLWFDLAVLGYALAPLLLLHALLPARWSRNHAANVARWVLVAGVLFGLLFVSLSELVFWQEFTARFDFIAVDYLVYTKEVIDNIRQSYPVGWLLAGLAVLTLAVTAVLARVVGWNERPLSGRRRSVVLAVAVLWPAAAAAFVSVDQIGRMGNAYADELASNGWFTFVAAFRRNELDYDRYYLTIPQDRADKVLVNLGVERIPLAQAQPQPPVEDETLHPTPFKRPPRNVVLVSVESLSAEFLGAYGSTAGLTPNLDRFAREGFKFERVLASGTRTVRGLEALSLGTPPVPGQAIVRRPNNEHLATIGELLQQQGFLTYFIYGGYGYFDNMNEYFRGNDYGIIDRTDFPKASIPFENVWGVADEALFDNTLTALDGAHAKGKRFFAHVMTTSNHRPFTYPAGRIDIPSPGGRDGAVKYTDYAIGRFVEQARAKPWFKDTLFVFVADHCASAAGKTRLPVAGYHIPLIFYAPALLPPGVYPKLASQIDVPPTLLHILAADGEDNFFGHSVFEPEALTERAFISNYQALGYYRQNVLTVLLPKRKVETYWIDPRTLVATPAPPDPALLEEAVAFYQTAASAFRSGALSPQPYRGKTAER